MLEFRFHKKGDSKILFVYKKNKIIGSIYEAYAKPREIEINSPLSLSEIEEISKALEAFRMAPLR